MFHADKPSSLIVVDGELKVGNNATIEASNGKNVIVTGGVYLEGKAYVNCDLECDSLESEIFLSKLQKLVRSLTGHGLN